MRLLPEHATQHAVSIPELLASRDERQARQHARVDASSRATGLIYRGRTGSD